MQLLTISAIFTLYSSNTEHTLQIYEWCQYMVSSGRMCQANLTSVPDVSPPGTVYLSNEEMSLLDAMYAKNHSRYSCLLRKYSESLRKAANVRRKSTFPCLAEWVPQGGYQDGDRELLQGPGLNRVATCHKRIIKECPNTGRKIIYSAACFESQRSRHSYSYVQVMDPEVEAVPVFGQIQKLITHQFGGNIYEIVIVKQFGAVHRDHDCGLWFVNSEDFHVAAFLLKDISQPLAVAFDSATLWFLNCNIDV